MTESFFLLTFGRLSFQMKAGLIQTLATVSRKRRSRVILFQTGTKL
jgi:hypothetical protein